jgi:hypothetical protein
VTNVIVDGNEIRNCLLGSSESLVLNGNVTNFTVSHNTIHDNDNIGIDFIGFEGYGPPGADQARNGTCVDNVVYNITSANNRAYGGDRAADGIYVDGGQSIVIERNKVDSCDIGIEVGAEHSGRTTSNIGVRNKIGAVDGPTSHRRRRSIVNPQCARVSAYLVALRAISCDPRGDMLLDVARLRSRLRRRPPPSSGRREDER